MSNDDHTSRARLTQLLGDRLADKLIEESKKASAEYSKLLLDITVKALKDRMTLTDDELAESRFNLVREEATALLQICMSSLIACEVVNLSCALHGEQDTSMTAYVIHVVSHYESEQKKRKAKYAADVVDALLTKVEEAHEDQLHHIAKTHSSGN